jgi:prephenate dehydratase
MDITIAIQGIKGSFHHQVAQEYFKNKVSILECNSFESVVKSMVYSIANKG